MGKGEGELGSPGNLQASWFRVCALGAPWRPPSLQHLYSVGPRTSEILHLTVRARPSGRLDVNIHVAPRAAPRDRSRHGHQGRPRPGSPGQFSAIHPGPDLLANPPPFWGTSSLVGVVPLQSRFPPTSLAAFAGSLLLTPARFHSSFPPSLIPLSPPAFVYLAPTASNATNTHSLTTPVSP